MPPPDDEPATTWRDIATAPKDGREVLLLSVPDELPDGNGGVFVRPARCAIGHWNPDGDSWVHDLNTTDPEFGEVAEFQVTGTWSSSGGWFEPGEVSHWMPLPKPPVTTP